MFSLCTDSVIPPSCHSLSVTRSDYFAQILTTNYPLQSMNTITNEVGCDTTHSS